MKKIDDKAKIKEEFLKQLQLLANELYSYVSTRDNQWVIKGFIDVFKNIYTITNDTKIISKIIEIHLFPKFLEFANKHGYMMVFPDKQNWYPDITFISKKDARIKFAVDLKTTYVAGYKNGKPYECNGFTLGSHGTYFINRQSTKNIQYPYSEYIGHYVLGILYERNNTSKVDEIHRYRPEKLESVPSVIKNFIFFAHEKWRIASDKRGSGNTANIGSIKKIEELIEGRGIFWQYFGEEGEKWFDEYWMNYGNITIKDDKTGKTKKITSLEDFLRFKEIDISKIKKRKTL